MSVLPVGIILAGGQSRRMGGGDKPLVRLAGKPMIAHVIENLRSQVPAIAINANGDPARFDEFGLPVIADGSAEGRGPLSGILAGMRWASEQDARAIVSVAGDTPFFPTDLVSRLMGACTEPDNRIVLAADSVDTHPVFGLWPTALADDLAHYLASSEGARVTDWAKRYRFELVEFAPRRASGQTFAPFFNVNTPDDLAAAEAYFKEFQR